jgi:hypothetical protein
VAETAVAETGHNAAEPSEVGHGSEGFLAGGGLCNGFGNRNGSVGIAARLWVWTTVELEFDFQIVQNVSERRDC